MKIGACPPAHPPTADWYLDGGHRNRILLALESRLPNEADWAFNKLVRLSFICTDNISLAVIPGVMDAAMQYARPYVRRMRRFRRQEQQAAAGGKTADAAATAAGAVEYTLFNQQQTTAAQGGSAHAAYFADDQDDLGQALTEDQLERTLQILHIFRNFSFIEANLPLLKRQIDLLEMIHLAMPASHPATVRKYQVCAAES